MATGVHICATDSGASTAGSGSARNAAHLARSVTVDQSWPAGAMAPASCRGSSRSVPCHGCTTYPRANGSAGSYVVRVMPSGSSSRLPTWVRQGSPVIRSATAPSSP